MVHYEGATRGNASYTDMYSVMYPSYSNMSRDANNTGGKPYFMCEFAHAMGNAVGNFSEYWNTIAQLYLWYGWLHLGLGRPEHLSCF